MFEISNVVILDPKILFLIAFIADTATVYPNGIKTLAANGLSTFFIKSKPVFSVGPRIMPKYTPDCLILCNWVLNDFILADELFAKALRNLETCV